MKILVNGEVSDGTVSVTDSAVLRGDGCFEVLRSYKGVPFALDEHVERLEDSARALRIDLPARSLLADWIEEVASECGDCAVRVLVTRGSAMPGESTGPVVIVFAHPWERGEGPARLKPVVAPWHAAGADWALAGAKILSYAPNVSASRDATSEGFGDALLLTVENVILEGPTFSVAWIMDGSLETPTLELGILDSITRRVVLEDARNLGIPVVEGEWELDRLGSASEVMALSTIREVQPVSVVGEMSFHEGPVTSDLARAFARRTG